jgi:hypothetical protein
MRSLVDREFFGLSAAEADNHESRVAFSRWLLQVRSMKSSGLVLNHVKKCNVGIRQQCLDLIQ